jgi:hypothetical protein
MWTFRNTLFHLHRQVDSIHIYLPMKMEQSVPKRRHLNSRRRVITQKKAYNNLLKLKNLSSSLSQHAFCYKVWIVTLPLSGRAVEEWVPRGMMTIFLSSSPYKVTSTSPMPFICVSHILFLLSVSVPRLQSVKYGLFRVNCVICVLFLVHKRKIRVGNLSDVLRDCSMNVLVAT